MQREEGQAPILADQDEPDGAVVRRQDRVEHRGAHRPADLARELEGEPVDPDRREAREDAHHDRREHEQREPPAREQMGPRDEGLLTHGLHRREVARLRMLDAGIRAKIGRREPSAFEDARGDVVEEPGVALEQPVGALGGEGGQGERGLDPHRRTGCHHGEQHAEPCELRGPAARERH